MEAKSKAKTAAERKRDQRKRDKKLGMAEMRLNLSSGERKWIEHMAEKRGFEDRTEYLVSLVRHDMKAFDSVSCHDNGDEHAC